MSRFSLCKTHLSDIAYLRPNFLFSICLVVSKTWTISTPFATRKLFHTFFLINGVILIRIMSVDMFYGFRTWFSWIYKRSAETISNSFHRLWVKLCHFILIKWIKIKFSFHNGLWILLLQLQRHRHLHFLSLFVRAPHHNQNELICEVRSA